MNDNILVKLKNAGFRIKNKWLVQSVSFQVEKDIVLKPSETYHDGRNL